MCLASRRAAGRCGHRGCPTPSPDPGHSTSHLLISCGAMAVGRESGRASQ